MRELVQLGWRRSLSCVTNQSILPIFRRRTQYSELSDAFREATNPPACCRLNPNNTCSAIWMVTAKMLESVSLSDVSLKINVWGPRIKVRVWTRVHPGLLMGHSVGVPPLVV